MKITLGWGPMEDPEEIRERRLHRDQEALEKGKQVFRDFGFDDFMIGQIIGVMLDRGLVIQEIEPEDLAHFREAWGRST